ncbi:MAG: hypothetical protein AAB367_03650 [Patescibacteria group bacterium]
MNDQESLRSLRRKMLLFAVIASIAFALDLYNSWSNSILWNQVCAVVAALAVVILTFLIERR